jgi:hypothetical protein
MKRNDPTGQSAAEAPDVGPGQRVSDLPAAMAEGARRTGPPAGRLPLTRTPLPGQTKRRKLRPKCDSAPSSW